MIRRPGLVLLLAAFPLAAAPAQARSPRTGDLALSFSVGADRPLGDDDFRGREVLLLSHETYWTGANAIRGTLGALDLPARDDSGRGDRSALFLTGGLLHNWMRGGPVFPYVTGGIGLYAMEERRGPDRDADSFEVGVNGGFGVEFRVLEDLTLRLEGQVHGITGEGPSTVAMGSVGVVFYY